MDANYRRVRPRNVTGVDVRDVVSILKVCNRARAKTHWNKGKSLEFEIARVLVYILRHRVRQDNPLTVCKLGISLLRGTSRRCPWFVKRLKFVLST